MSENACLVWFRHNLRLADNPALRAAIDQGGPVIPVFLWAPDEESAWAPASASRWWLHHSLTALATELEKLGSRLIVRKGPTAKTLLELARQAGARRVVWNRRYEPAVIDRDSAVKTKLRDEGLTADSYNGGLLFEPWQVQTQQGKPYQVYTPFWKACANFASSPGALHARPRRLATPATWPPSLAIDKLALLPKIDWAAGMREMWTPGEAGALARLEAFVGGAIGSYSKDRDRPDLAGTSALSPHLHFGEVSPARVWQRVLRDHHDSGVKVRVGEEVYLKELVWREFAHHLLYHFPDTTDKPLRSDFEAFPWRDDDKALTAWQKGQTGYPLVDAGMRQLWHTGWMHNRVRMVTASFLVKHLLLPWQAGARWFWDTLVDADLANNTLGWQWTAGCGADAAPYFRIFNPVTQGEKFDPEGKYVRKWVPELARLPDDLIHKPWEAGEGVLSAAGVRLGETYPAPVVGHKEARARALEALASIAKPAG